MPELRAIDGGKAKRAAKVAETRILECPCGCRTFVEARTGILIDKDGKVVHKGALTRRCVSCAKLVN
jgi:hypothetical protein